jgi:type I restriction enzyme S subunit
LKEKKQWIRKGILDTIISGENILNDSIRIKFNDYLDFTNGYSFKSSTYSNQGHYLIRITNVQAGKLVVNDKILVNLNDSNLKQFELKIGDIVISLTGNVGRSAIINKGHTPAALNQRVGKISIKNEKKLELDKMYLYQILQSSKFMKMVIDMGEGAAQHNISLRDIGEIDWLIPIDYKEQKRISTTLLDLDLEIETLDNELRKYKLIMQAMAHDLLTGKVRLV